MTASGSVRAWAELVRAGTVVAGSGICVAGARVAGRPIDDRRLGWAVASVALLIGFAQVVNDVVDIEIDRLQRRPRPLVRRAISVRAARTAAVLAGVGGLTAASVLGPRLLVAATAVLAASWLYSVRWKGTVGFGNLVVATLAGAPLPFGAGAMGRLTARVGIGWLVVALFMVAYEVLKTGRDIVGDRAGGLRTIATVHGVRATCRAAGVLCLVFAATSLAASWYASAAAIESG